MKWLRAFEGNVKVMCNDLRSSMSRISVIEEKVASASDGKSPASGSAPVDGATRDAVLKLRKLVAEIGDRVTRSENAIAKDKLDLLKLREVVGTALKKQKSEVETVMSSQESAKRKEEDSTKLLETLKERDRLVAAEVEVLRGKVEEMSKCLRESAEHRKVSESEISSRVRSIARRSENADRVARERSIRCLSQRPLGTKCLRRTIDPLLPITVVMPTPRKEAKVVGRGGANPARACMVANPVVIVHGETRVLRVYLLVIVMTRLAPKLARARGREVKAKGLPVVLMKL